MPLVFCALAVAAACELPAAYEYDDNPYGVVSHIAWSNMDDPVEAARMMGACHLGWNRVDCSWQLVETASNRWDFTAFNTAVDLCAREGITVLPILARGNWRKEAFCIEPYKPEQAWRFDRYVREIVRRYGMRMPVVEVINEPNGKMEAKDYATLLKIASKAIRETNPKVSVAFAGLAPSPVPYIRSVYEQGCKDCFDIMNIHPYASDFSTRPENHLEAEIAKVRQVMDEHGDRAKPIWITETGWASHQEVHIREGGLIRAGLKAVRPAQKTWRAVYAGISGAETDLDEAIAAGPVLELLPEGSTCVARHGRELVAGLEQGAFDVVVYPFGECCVGETHAAVLDFVKKGGVLVDLGGAPMWVGYFAGKNGSMSPDPSWPMQAEISKLRMGLTSFWLDKSYTEKWYSLKPTAAFPNARFHDKPPRAMYLFTPNELKEDDEFIPLLEAGKTKDGKPIVGAAAYRFNSDYKGGLVVGGINGGLGTRNTEERQALLLPRAIMIALSCGVEKFFWYEFHAREKDKADQEAHFGITRRNYVPKPAFSTYKTLIDRRPAGSVPMKGAWRSDDGDYFPRWMRPDAREGGAFWTIKEPYVRVLPAKNAQAIVFHNVYGMRIFPEYRDGAFHIKVSASPVYFEKVGE